MGNCLKTCFGQVKTKRINYFTGRYNNSDVNIEFENLIDDDEEERCHTVLTDDERNLLLNRRYTELVQEQQKVDAKLDKELNLEEENARLEEEAYNAARREASRAAKHARELERQKQLSKPQSNGSAKSWLGSDAGDWEIATEDDFETFLETVKAKSDSVRASVASMLNNNTSNPNQVITSKPTSPAVKPRGTVAPIPSLTNGNQMSIATSHALQPTGLATQGTIPVIANTSPAATSTSPAVTNTRQTPVSTPLRSHNSPGKKTGRPLLDDKSNDEGLVGSGQVAPDQVAGRPDVLSDASQMSSLDMNQSSRGMSYYVQPNPESTNHHPGNDDSDVEWEADFVSADSTPDPITVPVTSSTSTPSPSSNVKQVGSSNSATIPSRSQAIRTGLPSQSRTNGAALTNGRLPNSQETESISISSTSTPTIASTTISAENGVSGTAVKPKKSLDIDIDKFLEELDFDT